MFSSNRILSSYRRSLIVPPYLINWSYLQRKHLFLFCLFGYIVDSVTNWINLRVYDTDLSCGEKWMMHITSIMTKARFILDSCIKTRAISHSSILGSEAYVIKLTGTMFSLCFSEETVICLPNYCSFTHSEWPCSCGDILPNAAVRVMHSFSL